MKNVITVKLFISLALIFLFFTSNNINGQKLVSNKIKADPFYSFNNFILVKDGDKSFIISRYKTSNKEYLCFLSWIKRVYGADYPKVYKEMLPDTLRYPDVFNPDKANHTVKGITQKQAQAFCRWRTHRLNEFILIREGILGVDLNQFNEENFNTEAYLCLQYEGIVRNDLIDENTKEPRKVMHYDLILLPSFYIASKEQISICDSLKKIDKISNPKKIVSDLDWWFKTEVRANCFMKRSALEGYNSVLNFDIKTYEQKARKFLKKSQKELARQAVVFDTEGVITSDRDMRLFYLKNYASEMYYHSSLPNTLPNPFLKETIPYIEKDSLGRMDFVYIADNSDGTPVCIYRHALDEASSDNNMIYTRGFYCAMNLSYRLYKKLVEY